MKIFPAFSLLAPGAPQAVAQTPLKLPTSRIATYYEVIVKYDDGSYGRHELNHDPKFQKGVRVKVDSGKVERYP